MTDSNNITSTCTVKLTAVKVRGAAPNPAGRYEVRDTGEPGLVLRVGPTGMKVWYYAYKDSDTNKKQKYRIGTIAQYSLADARKKVGGLKGSDPAGEKRAQKAAQAASEARTVEMFLDNTYWPHYLAEKKAGSSTKKRIETAWKEFLDRDMASITPGELTTHKAARLKAVTAETYNRDRTALYTLFATAVKKGIITNNPFDQVERAEELDDQRVRYLGMNDDHEAFDKGEYERFMDALIDTDDAFRTMVELALNTGMRRGEIFQLRWSAVSFTRASITVTAVTAKTSTTRHIPMNAKVLHLMKSWKASHDVIDIHGLVFPSPVNGEVRDNIKRQWGTLVKRARVINFRFHDLRHDFASRLVMAGVDIYEVKDLLGHKTVTTTERYAHLNPAKLQKAVEVLSESR